MKSHGKQKSVGSRVAILDAGAQYGKVIDRRVRSLKVYCDLLPLDTPYDQLLGYDAYIISGGPESVYADAAPHPDKRLWDCGKPIFGICYGMQLINQAYGGTVGSKRTREDGQCGIAVQVDNPLFEGLDAKQEVLMSHGDSIARLASGFRVSAKSGGIIAGISDSKRKLYGVQFHPEVDLTENGETMFKNFLFSVAGLSSDYALEDRLEAAIDYIKRSVGKRQVLVFASGGVDSTVCAVLLGKALPASQIKVVHVDTGFMRQGESLTVKQALKTVQVELSVIDAAEDFYNGTTIINGLQTPPLKEVVDPEVKRAIIGDTFIKVMERTLAELKLDPENTVLAQGTLRPDLIESASHLASSKAATIKTHHNDTPLVRALRTKGRVIEPLQDLHKDEVRQLGEQLGIPAELVWRQPFPGPGLAVRLLCASESYKPKNYDNLGRRLAKIVDGSGFKSCLLPIRTVGVQGDGRSYSLAAALSGEPDWPHLFELAKSIPKSIHDINRVVYLFGEPPKIWDDITPTYPTPDAVRQLREADKIVNDLLIKHGLTKKLSQVPVVSFPCAFGVSGNRSIAIRPFITNDFMTGRPAEPGVEIPHNILDKIVVGLLNISGISRVVYDLTPKPPGTTEWE